MCGGILLLSMLPTLIVGEKGNWLIFFWLINFMFIAISFSAMFFYFEYYQLDFGINKIYPNNPEILENWQVSIAITISTIIDVFGMFILRKLSKASWLKKKQMHPTLIHDLMTVGNGGG